MHSRARLLIEKDYSKLKGCNLWGIEAQPMSNESYFDWFATVRGEVGTEWEGGVFRLYIMFDEYYNDQPPVVFFHTIPFHPNVDPNTGRPSVDFLDDVHKWDSSYDLAFILLSVQSLLSKPILENAVNPEAVDALLYHPKLYRQTVRRCVVASQHLSSNPNPVTKVTLDVRGRSPAAVRAGSVPVARKPSSRSVPLAGPSAKIAFEDYHTTWSRIATSQPATRLSRPRSGIDQPNYSKSLDVLERKITSQKLRPEQMQPPEGSSDSTGSEKKKRKNKLDQIDRMRQLYMCSHYSTTRCPTKPSVVDDQVQSVIQESRALIDPGDNEVDALVNWTRRLDLDLDSL